MTNREAVGGEQHSSQSITTLRSTRSGGFAGRRLMGAALLAPVVVAALLPLAACSGTTITDGMTDLDQETPEFGELVAELTTVPSGVLCLKLTSSNGNVSKLITVSAGGSSATASLGQLALGPTTVTAAAYNVACGSITATTAPTWLGEPLETEVRAVGTQMLRLTLVPAGNTNVTVDFVNPVVAIEAGMGNFTFSIGTAGDLRAWGLNDKSQLGDGTTTNRSTPVPIASVTGPTSIDAGLSHACAVTASGALRCWGHNSDGQLGDGTTTARTSPVTVIASGVKKVATGYYHTCALMTNSTVRCAGNNSDGQLGINSTVGSTSFVNVTGNYSDVAAGGYHTCALSTTTSAQGNVRCWGRNSDFQVGITNTADVLSPTTISLNGAVSLSLGVSHSCALVADATVRCWGQNTWGQLGNGTTTSSNIPSSAQFDGEFVAVAAGSHNTCAIASDENAYCWGLGGPQTGVGNATNRNTPTKVREVSNVLTISAGPEHACATTAAGGAWCWGHNTSGQLGNGSTATYFTPTRVAL